MSIQLHRQLPINAEIYQETVSQYSMVNSSPSIWSNDFMSKSGIRKNEYYIQEVRSNLEPFEEYTEILISEGATHFTCKKGNHYLSRIDDAYFEKFYERVEHVEIPDFNNFELNLYSVPLFQLNKEFNAALPESNMGTRHYRVQLLNDYVFFKNRDILSFTFTENDQWWFNKTKLSQKALRKLHKINKAMYLIGDVNQDIKYQLFDYGKIEQAPPEFRKNIREYILELLSDLSDVRKTQKEWAGEIHNVERSFTEDQSMFFDDWLSGQDLYFNVANGLLSKEEAKTLMPFYEEFYFYGELEKLLSLSESEIIKDPQWYEVARVAGEVYHQLKDKLCKV